MGLNVVLSHKIQNPFERERLSERLGYFRVSQILSCLGKSYMRVLRNLDDISNN